MRRALMRRATARLGVLLACGAWAVLPACASARFPTSPPQLASGEVPHQWAMMTAQRYEFTPTELHVKAGTFVTLTLTALDGTHGFSLGDWGIDVRLDENQPVTVEFFAPTPGTYVFTCSHLCGIGHFGMSGAVVVDP